jgi:hypothetical protein
MVKLILEFEDPNENLTGKQIKKINKKNMKKLEKLIDHDNDVFSKNYKVIELGKKYNYQQFDPSVQSTQQKNDDGSLEFVNDVNITTRRRLTFNDAEVKSINVENGLTIETNTFNDSKLYQFVGISGKKNKLYRFHKAESNYAGASTKGVKMNSSRALVEQKYGLPTLELATTTGSLLCYKWKNIIFFLNEQGLVTEWVVWQSLSQ